MGPQTGTVANGLSSKYGSNDTPVARLDYVVQSYDWGKLGSSSKVAACAYSNSNGHFQVKETTPYAEVSI